MRSHVNRYLLWMRADLKLAPGRCGLVVGLFLKMNTLRFEYGRIDPLWRQSVVCGDLLTVWPARTKDIANTFYADRDRSILCASCPAINPWSVLFMREVHQVEFIQTIQIYTVFLLAKPNTKTDTTPLLIVRSPCNMCVLQCCMHA